MNDEYIICNRQHTDRRTDRQRTWGNAATYRGVKEFQNSLHIGSCSTLAATQGTQKTGQLTNHTALQYYAHAPTSFGNKGYSSAHVLLSRDFVIGT